MIPRHLAEKLEILQRRALKIIFGWNQDIDIIMAAKNIETLEDRREAAVLKFALRNEHVEKYGRKWFVKNVEIGIGLRPNTRNVYR